MNWSIPIRSIKNSSGYSRLTLISVFLQANIKQWMICSLIWQFVLATWTTLLMVYSYSFTFLICSSDRFKFRNKFPKLVIEVKLEFFKNKKSPMNLINQNDFLIISTWTSVPTIVWMTYVFPKFRKLCIPWRHILKYQAIQLDNPASLRLVF